MTNVIPLRQALPLREGRYIQRALKDYHWETSFAPDGVEICKMYRHGKDTGFGFRQDPGNGWFWFGDCHEQAIRSSWTWVDDSEAMAQCVRAFEEFVGTGA